MWRAFRALAARLGISPEQVAEIERGSEEAIVQHPLAPDVGIRVRPDPDWSARLGEAWNGTLVNSRRESAGSIQLADGFLTIADATSPQNAITVRVPNGCYEVVLIVAHRGSAGTYDYEEHVSHAFALRKGAKAVASIAPLTDDAGLELGIIARTVAFAATGVLQDIAGDHAGRWLLRFAELFHPKNEDGTKRSLKSIRMESDRESGAAILIEAGEQRGDFPFYRLADADGDTVGILADFFVDNRP